ncbi:MAG: hypothetical protein V1851_03275 [Patescibacteria group bacterium]
MDFKTDIYLDEKETSRQDFLERFGNLFLNLISREHFRLIIILREIIKNIYDHADGKGRIQIKKEGSCIQFIINDYGTKKFNLGEIIPTDSKEEIDYGAGLRIIQAGTDGLNLKIKTSRGFSYYGRYQCK